MAGDELLTSWADTPTRRTIIGFVDAVTTEGSDRFVPAAERIATFDNDGTLWTEKPIPIQLDFTLFRMAEQARADAALADRQPYKAALAEDYHWLGAAMVKHYHGDDADMGLLMGAVSRRSQGWTSRRSPPRSASGSRPPPTRPCTGRTCRAGSSR